MQTSHLAIGALLVALLAAGGLLGASEGPQNPCTAEKFYFPKVETACAAGGRKAANKLMKAAMKNAKASGVSMTCKSCHTDTKSWGLTDNAIEDYRQWET
jgi:hypothetical protein